MIYNAEAAVVKAGKPLVNGVMSVEFKSKNPHEH